MKKLFVAIACVGSVYAGEFVSLFNGKDFTGWGGAGKPEQPGYVIKEGGIIESTKKCRFLITEKEYSNYVFEFEFKLNDERYIRILFPVAFINLQRPF